ncbi:hypothetical protein [Nonomuraea gerenzanensis]|uniref:Uncharacterized protein n=1 Tax=Nonomuraea gerenzanensis TaxID=93944 RepID=A0A1M4DYF0_9ACTN|nr:hypothetical protein [Nonomuraea gerenzanensis]UBU13853.1 hypothetical protein LCN96_02105 [Nonomuraea gerenzanensis]SBO91530.1 hypothetical protein BN4615_P1044 [Nonomuraea gerenzanensis]
MTATLLAGGLALATSCGTTTTPAERATIPAAQKPPAVSNPVASTPVTDTPAAQDPKPVKPTGDAINVHRIRWTKAKGVSKGKKVQLTWWSGVEPCTVLDRVKVKETRKKVTITLYEGTSPKAKNMSCIMIAVEKTTTVKLKSPLGKRKIVDGAKS